MSDRNTLMMTPDEMRVEAHRVISGNAGLPPIAFPHETAAMDVVVTWALRFIENTDINDEIRRALFIRKLAAYVVRTGPRFCSTAYYGYGTRYFTQKPETLDTKLTFGGAAKRALDSESARLRRIDGPPRDTSNADLKLPLVEKPLLLVAGDYMLHQLLHAQHVLEAGMEMGNCLVHEVKGKTLPNPSYWIPIKHRHRLLFSLSHRAQLVALFSIVDGVVVDMEFIQTPRGLQRVMPLVTDTLQMKLGPLWPASTNIRWPVPATPPLPGPYDANQLSFSFWGPVP